VGVEGEGEGPNEGGTEETMGKGDCTPGSEDGVGVLARLDGRERKSIYAVVEAGKRSKVEGKRRRGKRRVQVGVVKVACGRLS
jgi:hypothetical protein